MQKSDMSCMLPFVFFYLIISAVLLGGYRWGTFACGTLLMIWLELTVSSLVLTLITIFTFVIVKHQQKKQDGRN